MQTLKRLVSVILTLCLAVPIMVLPVFAGEPVQIAVSSASAAPGENVAITVDLAANPGIFGLMLNLVYDDSALEVLSITGGAVIDLPTPPPVTANPLILSFEAANVTAGAYATGTGTIATINFRVRPGTAAGVRPVTVTPVEFVDANFNQAGAALIGVTNGAVTVTAPGGGTTSPGDTLPPSGGDTGGAFAVTRTNARNANIQMVGLRVYEGGMRVVSTVAEDNLSDEFILADTLDITTGDLQRNNGRWRFDQNPTSRMNGAFIEVVVRNGLNTTDEWVRADRRIIDRWNLEVSVTSSRVWAAVGINDDGFLNLDSHPAIVATGSVTSNDRITLSIDGRRARGANLRLEVEAQVGEREEIEDGFDVIYMDGPEFRRIRVNDFINRARIYTEHNGIITARLHQRDYYVHVSNRATAVQADIMDTFGFEAIRTLSQIGLPASATITWDMDFNYWVYTVRDGVLVLLGRSSDQLPLVDVFFFSAVELEIPGEVGGADYVPPADGGPVGDLPDWVNANFNPPTGRC